MKISQLIDLLTKYKDKYGDLPVYHSDETTNEVTTIRHWREKTDHTFSWLNHPELVELDHSDLYTTWDDEQDEIK